MFTNNQTYVYLIFSLLISSEEKAKLLRKIGAQIDEKDQELLGFMSSLQLDYLSIHTEPDRLPQVNQENIFTNGI